VSSERASVREGPSERGIEREREGIYICHCSCVNIRSTIYLPTTVFSSICFLAKIPASGFRFRVLSLCLGFRVFGFVFRLLSTASDLFP
jgi:hypothetical protein